MKIENENINMKKSNNKKYVVQLFNMFRKIINLKSKIYS